MREWRSGRAPERRCREGASSPLPAPMGALPSARRLYERFGFEVVGTLHDRFRVDEVTIDDTLMTLRLPS